jgi:hypothetical protein
VGVKRTTEAEIQTRLDQRTGQRTTQRYWARDRTVLKTCDPNELKGGFLGALPLRVVAHIERAPLSSEGAFGV